MLSLLVCAMLGQFKVGDEVYVKPPGAFAWKTSTMAAQRYRPPQVSFSAGTRPEEIPDSVRTRFQKNEKLSVLSIEDYDGEKIVRIKDDRNQTWWIISTDLGNLDESAKQAIGRDGLAEKLRPFCVTKPEHDALTIAVGKGLDPITMTAKDAAALSPSQRKALSAVKARYLRAKKK